jgi:hypothetical protein
MASTDRPEDEEGSGIGSTLLVGGLVLLFAVAIVALVYLAV